MSNTNLEKHSTLSARERFWEALAKEIKDSIIINAPDFCNEADEIADDVVSSVESSPLDALIEEETHTKEVLEFLESIRLRYFNNLEVTEQRMLENLLLKLR